MSKENQYKVWVVKYWQTKGIYEELCSINGGNTAFPVDRNNYQCFSKSQYALTKEEAVTMAEKSRAKRIKSLNKQLEAIKNITF